MYRHLLITIIAVIALSATGAAQNGDVYVSSVTGLIGANTVGADSTVRFTISINNDMAEHIVSLGIGFRVYTTQSLADPLHWGFFDPIDWEWIDADWIVNNWLNGGLFWFDCSVDGYGADTIGFHGYRYLYTPGIPPGTHQEFWWIETSAHEDGDTLCIDSSYFPPWHDWYWCKTSGPCVEPTWSGPHCYAVSSGGQGACCDTAWGQCRIAEWDDCDGQDEVYRGNGTTCDTDFCPPVVDMIEVGPWDNGYIEFEEVRCGENLTFNFFMQHNYTDYEYVCGFSTGFRVYSPDGAVWTPLTYGIPDGSDIWGYFDDTVFFVPAGITGSGADTVGLVAASGGPGWPEGSGINSHWVSTSVDCSQVGKTICIDSCWFPPGYPWILQFYYGPTYRPRWTGPHCFEILPAGCCAHRGDVDHSGVLPIDIADLVYLVSYMFDGGPEPACFDEADVDASGAAPLDISDLVYLVDYMFRTGPEPAPCP